MNRSVESLFRLINITTSGLLAGSLGFGEAALVPGWEKERSRVGPPAQDPVKYFNAIGPAALVSSLILAAGGKSGRTPRVLDLMASAGLAGVLGATVLGTVPITQKLDESVVPADYADSQFETMMKTWNRAHVTRTVLGVGAFFCAAAAVVAERNRRR